MSDDAAVWKIGFGLLVLALCGAVALRKHQAPPSPPPAAVVPQTAPAIVPLPPAAPPDEKDDPAPRLEVAIEDARVQRSPVAAKPQRRIAARRARRFVPARIQRVVAARPQYPFDPRERWNPRF